MRQEHSVKAIDYAPLPPLWRSSVGVASFYISMVAVATIVAVFHWAVEGRRASDMMAYKVLSLTLILPAVGTVLGLVSIFQRRRYRGLPIAGLTINVLLALLVLLAVVPSLLHELKYW